MDSAAPPPPAPVQVAPAPPPPDVDQTPQIPGKERLDEAVGKAVGGTVIPSDIPPSSMPTTTKLEAEKSSPSEQQPHHQAKDSTDHTTKEGAKPKTVGAYPVETHIGWTEAYKSTDGPMNEFREKSIWMDDFARSALFSSFWSNAAVTFTIPLVCFIAFKLGGGFVSLILIIAFGATYYKNTIRRFKRNARDDIMRELIRNTLENETESTEWINNFLSKFWLIYEPVLSGTIVQIVDGILVDWTPGFCESLRLTQFTLGSKAPRVEHIRTFPNTDSNIVEMDWRISFTPTDIEDMTPRQLRTQVNPKICLTIRLGGKVIGAGVPVLVEDVSLRGDVRIRLTLIPNFPHIKTLEFYFLEKPTIDYVLKPVGGETLGMDIAHIPGLQSFIRDQTHAVLGPMMYAPNVYPLDLEQMMTGGAALNAAVGVIQFTIYNAKDLKNVELVGNSDPYVKIRLGNRPALASTAVQNDTLNPVWNETNVILINNLNETIHMEIFDKDNVRKDRPLGEATFDLQALEEDHIQDDVWCKVIRNGKERGAIRIRAAYFPIEKPHATEDGSEPVPVESNSGILSISLTQAKDIAQDSRIKSHCRLTFNGRAVHESRNVLGSNPGYWSEVDVFVTDLKSAQFGVEVISEGDVIGAYGTTAAQLLTDTKEKVDWVSLKGGSGAGKLKMTGVWKPILMGDDLNPTTSKPAFGVLRVKLLAGRDIRNVEIGGSSDPYTVIVGAGGIGRGRTKVIESNLNPVWNEIHYVAVGYMKQFFEFEVFDYQNMTKDRPLGKTTFKVSDVVEELPNKAGYVARPVVDRWAPLKQKDGADKGELHYEISFFPCLNVAQDAAEQEGATLPPGTISHMDALDYDSGVFVVHLIGADLDRTGTYCEFYVDSDFYQFKSQVQKSRNPRWNEVVDLFVKELEYAKLVIQVKEKSSMEKDPIIGSFTSNIRALLENPSIEGASFPLLDKHDQRGSIKLKFEFKPVPIDLLPTERLDNMGNLTVTLVRAKNLPAADRSGLSDPFFVFKVNGKDVYKSEVIKKTLDPEYNEQFNVPINSRAEDEMTLEVFDWNQIGGSKSLGTGVINLQSIQPVLPNEFMIPLQSKFNQGEVLVRIKFMPEFLSSNKRKSGFGATFLAHGGAAVAGGVLDVTGAVGKGALKGVGAVGKGVLGGLSAGASAVGLKKSDRSSTILTAVQSTASGEAGSLTIHVIEAEGLQGVDRGGTSDPYVKVTVGNQSVLKTKIKKETLAPSWNESTSVHVSGQPVNINFLVKDYNTIGGNKDLGACDISPWEHIKPGQNRADF